MNHINNLGNSSFITNLNNDNCELTRKNKENNFNQDKTLCKHCGRTAKNGIRCLGICVADNEY